MVAVAEAVGAVSGGEAATVEKEVMVLSPELPKLHESGLPPVPPRLARGEEAATDEGEDVVL